MMRWLTSLALLGFMLTSAIAFARHADDPLQLEPLALTPVQRTTLTAHPVLRLGVESNWAPIEFIDANGAYSGVVSSYMRAVETQLGIRFEIVRKDSFGEVLAAFDRGEIDVLSALGKTEAREAAMRFTQPYITFTDGIIVRSSEPYVEHLSDFPAGKRLAVVEGYGSNIRAAASHPQLVVVSVRTTEEALFAVSTGRADLAIASLAVAYHEIQNRGLTNLRMAANYDEFEQSMAMAVQPKLEALVPLFNQALDAIPRVTRNALREQWTQVAVDRGIARSTVLLWSVVALVVLGLMGAWVALLLSQQRRRAQLLRRAEQAESQARGMIEAMPALFWILRVESGRPGQFTFFGNHANEVVGVKPGQMNVRFDDVLLRMPAEDRERLQLLMAQHSQSLSAFRFEHRRLDEQGREVGWSHVQAAPHHDEAGMVWHGCSIDISERKNLESALEKSRNQLQELAAGVPGALWQFRREADGSQSYGYMSDGIVGITGRTPAETNRLMQDKSFISVHPDDQPILQALMQRLTEKSGIDEARYRLRTVAGGWKWVQVAARALPIGADGALVWNGVTLDATLIQQTEEALRAERQRLEDLADSFPGALWRMTRKADGVLAFDYVSKGISQLTGNTPEAVIGGTVNPLAQIAPAERTQLIAALDHSAASLTPLEIEFTYQRLDGSTFRLGLRAGVRRIEGYPVWTGVGFDVSERYRLQQQLADVRGRIEDIAANFPGAIFQVLHGVDGSTRFTYVSEGITALIGRPPRSFDGRELFENYNNIHADDRKRVRAASENIIRQGCAIQLDYRLLDVHGAARWVHCAMTARTQADGSVVINGLLLNAEESKRLESELRSASERAEAASRTKSRFLANMSHEIRTPMNAVIGLAHIAMTSETNPMQQARIGKIHRAGKALLKLLNDILEYSRLDAGKFTPVLAPFELAEIKDSLRLFCSPAADTKGLVLVIDCPESLPQHWLGDATRIQQILLNLLTNAIKFTDSGRVTLQVRPLVLGEGLCFTVHDTGIGMTAAEVQRVFEAFEQASGETERRHGGSGLGLSIARELVTALGGRISVESTPGQGTCFTVELPLAPAVLTAPQKPLGDIEARLSRLSGHLAQRDTTGGRNSLAALRMVLLPQGRGSELHELERLLAGFDIEAAQIELARLSARWGILGSTGARQGGEPL